MTPAGPRLHQHLRNALPAKSSETSSENVMKNRRKTKLIAIVLTVAVLAACWMIWGARRSTAVIAVIKTTGMFTLAGGQRTSAHVVNTWTGREHQTIIDYTVLDGAGNVLARSNEQTLLPGQSADFEYGTGVYDPIPGTNAQRATIRLVLRVEGASPNRNSGTPGPDDFIATQEVFNIGDGKTTVFLPYIEQ